MDESQSLVSFQIAGLLIQNSFRYLLNAMKSFNKRRLFKNFTVWKNRTLKIPQAARMKIKNSIVAVYAKLKKFETMARCRTAWVLQDSFLRIVLISNLKDQELKQSQEEQKIKSSHDNELQTLSKSIKSMQESQDTLDKALKKVKTKEDLSKTQSYETHTKRSETLKSRKKVMKDLESSEKIEELREENQEIKEKIELIEQNINQFLYEMSNFIETTEETEKTLDKRKVSSKRIKIPKKPRGNLNTVDLSKIL